MSEQKKDNTKKPFLVSTRRPIRTQGRRADVRCENEDPAKDGRAAMHDLLDSALWRGSGGSTLHTFGNDDNFGDALHSMCEGGF